MVLESEDSMAQTREQQIQHEVKDLHTLCFVFELFGDIRGLHSFPTRRSSDLGISTVLLPARNKTDLEEIPEDARKQLARILGDRKSTRLNSSHPSISYAVFCLKKKTHPFHGP